MSRMPLDFFLGLLGHMTNAAKMRTKFEIQQIHIMTVRIFTGANMNLFLVISTPSSSVL